MLLIILYSLITSEIIIYCLIENNVLSMYKALGFYQRKYLRNFMILFGASHIGGFTNPFSHYIEWGLASNVSTIYDAQE